MANPVPARTLRRTILVIALMGGLLAPLTTLPSTSVAQPSGPAPVAAPSTDLATAQERARVTGQAVRVDSLTTETGEVSAQPDGSLTAEIAAEPQRMLQDGSWVPINTDLVPTGTELAPAASPTDLEVSDGGSERLVSLHDGDRSLSLTWPTALPAPTLVDGRAIYSVADGIDLAVDASDTGFGFNFVVRDAAAAQNPLLQQLRFGWSGQNVTLVETDAGFEARAADGEVVFAGPRPRMWDAATPAAVVDAAGVSAAIDASEDTASVDLALDVDATQLTLSAPRDWITAPERVFPLVVDPSLDKYQDNWAMVWSDGQTFWNSKKQDHRVGYDGWNGMKKSRLFYTMSLDNLTHKHITSATFIHSQYHSPNFDCNLGSYGPGVELHRTGPISKSTSWSHQPDWDDSVLAVANVAHGHDQYCPGDTQTEWGGSKLTAAVQTASSAGQTKITFGLKSADEHDRDGWRRFHRKDSRGRLNPKLIVEYNTVPDAPTALGIQYARNYDGHWYVPDRTPLVSASVRDADAGQHLVGRFGMAGRTVTSAGASSGSRVAVQWPAVADGNYAMSVQANDGIDWSPPSTAFPFTVDGYAPTAPVLRVTGNPNPLVGQRVYLTLDSPSTDVTGYLFGVGTTTPTTPYDLTPSTLGAAKALSFVVPRSGPNVITARAVDRAGNLSTVARIEVKAAVTLPWDIYGLDGNGADVRQNGRTATLGAAYPLAGPAGTTWVGGHTGLAADKALDVRAGRPVRQLATSATEVDSSQSFTMGSWVYIAPPTAQKVAVYQAIAGLTDGTSSAATIGLYQAAGGTAVRASFVLDSASADTNARAAAVGAENLPVGRWVQLVGVYNRETSTMQLYVNATLTASKTAVPPPFRASRLYVGQSPNDAHPQPFGGVIDAVRLYRGPADASVVGDYFHATA